MTNSKTEQTILAYNKNAKRYNAKFADFAAYKEKIIEFGKTFIPSGARILDLGCGPGNNITILQSLDNSYSFTGVDLSSKLLKIAKEKHPSSTFVHRNICTLQVEADAKYESILASFCVVHLTHTETRKLVQYISESLVQGGSLYISFMEGCSSGFESTSFSEDEIFFNYYQVADIVKLLGDFGLEVKGMSTQDYPEQDGALTVDVFIFATKC
jgi:2-polyprenyl-3-methyl-5-hydroxy-6-metoxy-1,4-benzoquinol methylase